jgi:alkanesulfonate monooxygenase SsuD/methylene tetrahydromethanopterin reductase-like flavin-dependent oxidoreductase (luciferase family)
MPERGASTPMRTGLFCASAGENTDAAAAIATTVVLTLMKLRRVTGIDPLTHAAASAGRTRHRLSLTVLVNAISTAFLR